MPTKEFHIGDVLTVTTNLCVSPQYIAGVQDLLSFLVGESIQHHQIPRVGQECRPFLLKQFPQLASPEMNFAVAELKRRWILVALERIRKH